MKFPPAEEVGEVGATGNKSGGSGTVQAPSLGGGLIGVRLKKTTIFNPVKPVFLGGGFLLYNWICHPEPWEDEPNLTNIFQMGWFNHQLVWNLHLF